MTKLKLFFGKCGHAVTRPAVIISCIGIAGFIIDMTLKPVSNAGLILLLAAASPWIIKTVKRLKVGEYLEIETLTQSEAERKLEKEAEEVLAEDPVASPIAPGASREPAPGIAVGSRSPDRGRIQSMMRNMRITETMALDWLERQLDVPVRRSVRVENIELDGLALTEPKPTIIEIKYAQSSKDISRRIRAAREQLNAARHRWRSRTGVDAGQMLILVTSAQPGDDEFAKLEDAIERVQRSDQPLDIRVVSSADIGLGQGWLKPLP